MAVSFILSLHADASCSYPFDFFPSPNCKDYCQLFRGACKRPHIRRMAVPSSFETLNILKELSLPSPWGVGDVSLGMLTFIDASA